MDVDQPENNVGVADRIGGDVHHVFAQLVGGLVHARCVEKDDLIRIGRQHAHELVARGLGLGAGDGNLLPKQAVEQRRLAHIGPADDGHKAAAVIW